MLRILITLTLALHCLQGVGRTQACSGIATDLHFAGADGPIRCSAVYDDGAGTALYVGGDFETIGDKIIHGIARWNGTSWSALPQIHADDIECLLVFNGRLYVGGRINFGGGVPIDHYLVSWNGTSWEVVLGEPDNRVTALGTFQGKLVVGGDFAHAGGSSCSKVAQFDPSTSTWTGLGVGFDHGTPRCFATYMEPAGARLFVGGRDLRITGGTANPVARWDGTTWTIPGGGVSGAVTSYTVESMLVYDAGFGPELVIGGQFFFAGGVTAQCIARWNGSSWSALGFHGIDFNCSCGWTVSCLILHDDGSGPALYAGGTFLSADNVQSAFLVRYRSGAWVPMTDPPDSWVMTCAEFGGKLIVAGRQGACGNVRTEHIGQWDGTSWSSLGGGHANGGPAIAFCTHDDGSGPALFASFIRATDTSVFPFPLQRWQQGGWTPVPLPSGSPGYYEFPALLSADDGSGPALFVGGVFSDTSGIFRGVQRLDATGYTQLGVSAQSGAISALAEYDEGAGARIFACGEFDDFGGITSHGISRWDGQQWTQVGGVGITSFAGVGYALSVFDDGSGPALYLGGEFTSICGVPANNIARWDGSTWSSLGSGVDRRVVTMTVHDDGTGAGLYAGGAFDVAGGTPAARVACWKNGSWSAVGAGLTGGPQVQDLESFDDGAGTALFATGMFTQSGATITKRLARWNGSAWQAVGEGLNAGPQGLSPEGRALGVFQEGVHASLWVGGTFGTLDSVVSNDIARLCSDAVLGAVFCFGDGSGTACPCGNASSPAAHSGCLSSLGVGGVLVAAGDVSLANDTISLHGSSMPNSFALYFQGNIEQQGGAGAVFGDGLRCAGGNIRRLGLELNSNGASSYPASGQLPVSIRGGVTTVGSRTYQAWYRNAAAFCTPSGFNLGNGVRLTWAP